MTRAIVACGALALHIDRIAKRRGWIWTVRPLPPELRPLVDGKHEIVAAGTLAELPGDAWQRVDAAIAGALVPYDTDLFRRMPKLRVVSRVGIGYDNIVVPDATAARVAVCNTPDGPTISTAEHALTLMLMVAKKVKASETALRDGTSAGYYARHTGIELAGKVLGLVGCFLGAFLATLILVRSPAASVVANLPAAAWIVALTFLTIAAAVAAEQLLVRGVAVDSEWLGMLFWAVVTTSWWLVPSCAGSLRSVPPTARTPAASSDPAAPRCPRRSTR